MPNNKVIKASWNETGITAYAVILRNTDGYFLNDADGTFAVSASDMYKSLTENTYAKGLYEATEARQTWNDGLYTILAYKQAGGSPAPASDTIIASGTMYILSDTEVDLQASSVDAIWDEVLTTATHNTASSAGRRLRQIADLNVIYEGTAAGPGINGNQLELDAGASSTNGAYDPSIITITEGTGAGQCRAILDYNGTTKIVTVDRDWRINPDGTSKFMIQAFPGREHVNEGLLTSATSTTAVLNTNAASANDAYLNQILFIRSGLGQDQARHVHGYDGATRTVTVDRAWDVTPDSTSAYVMLPITALSILDIEESTIIAKEATVLTRATSADIPTVAQIDTQLSSTHGSGVWGSSGSGANQVVVQLYETATTTPIADVSILVLNSDQTITVATGTSNASGQVTFALDSATYKLRMRKTSANFTVPSTLTVSGSHTHTYYGDPFSPSIPAADLQTLYGWVRGLDTVAVSGVVVHAKLIKQQAIGDDILANQKLQDTTDSNGYFELQLAQGAYVTVEAATHFKLSITVSTDTTKSLADYLT